MAINAQLFAVTVDCPDPMQLARFYQGFLGGHVLSTNNDFAVLTSDHNVRLDFQRVTNHQPPSWPDPAGPRRLHLDLSAEDLEHAEKHLLSLGGTLAEHQPGGQRFRVLIDPAGHPICLATADAAGIPTEETNTIGSRLFVVDHDPAWQAQGLALANGLHSLLAPLAVHVEHIGSTAIPGMAAKPIFDLQISVNDLQEAEHAFDQPLADQGFQQSVIQRDHVPAGCDDDPGRWTKRYWSRRGHSGEDVNLHVRILGAPNERLALLFRDWFRSHPDAIPAYSSFKSVLADTVSDVGSYSDIKDPVVDLVITFAESWATATGWTPHADTRSRT